MQLDGQFANERFTGEWTDEELDAIAEGLAADEPEEDGEGYDRFYRIEY